VIPAGGAEDARDLTGATDKAVGWLTLADIHESGAGAELLWSPDSRTLYFPISERGDTRLYRVSLDGSALAPLTPANLEMGSFSISRDGQRFGLHLGNATELADVYLGALSGSGIELRRLTHVNQPLLDEAEM